MKKLTRKMWRVTRMEFLLTAANRTFVIVTLLGPFVIVAVSVLPSLLAMRGNPEAKRIAVVGTQDALVRAVGEGLSSAGLEVETKHGLDESIKDRVRNGELSGYVEVPETALSAGSIRYVTNTPSQWQTIGTIESVLQSVVVRFRLLDAGLDRGQLTSILARPSLEVREVSMPGEEADADDGPSDLMSAMFTGLAFTFMLYMTVLLYGQTIGRSVISEKTNKTVEIMLSSVTPRDLLFGKILGKAGAGLLQYGIWISMAVLLLQVVGPAFDVTIPIAGGAVTWLNLVGFFLLAFFMYAAVYAALGAASEDEQHLGQLAWPVILFLVVPMVLIGVLTSNPDGSLARGLSIFPLTAPIVMFQRTLLGNPAPWELGLSLGLMIATILGIGLMAAKIFRVGLLMTGKRFSIGEILRWLRY